MESVIRTELRKYPLVRKLAQEFRILKGRLSQKEAIAAYLQNPGPKGLHIGSSQRILQGWLNTDIAPSRDVLFLDATKTLPMTASTLDFIFGEHFIEHITYQQGCSFMKEVFRVLKPGGVIRLATPSLEKMTALYHGEFTQDKEAFVKQYLALWHPTVQGDGRAFIFDSLFRNYGHQFIYDKPTLRQLAETAGLVDIRFVQVRESSHEFLRGLEVRAQESISDLNLYETMVIEATRP